MNLFLVIVFVLKFGVSASGYKNQAYATLAGFFTKQACDYDHESERSALMSETMCAGEPRDVFIELKPNAAHEQVSPGAVWVKQCVGLCYDEGEQCVGTEVRERKVPVRIFDVTTGKESCATYTVEEHLQCGCARACTAPRVLNARSGICQCPNWEERKKCVAKKSQNFKWNRAKCTCEDKS